MPRLIDKNEIRTCLRRDRAWSVYALGDLEPPMFPKTLWFAPDLTLIVRDYGTAILFAMGAGSVREALECVTGPVHLQVQRDALDEVARHAAVSSPRLMWRMTWTGRGAAAALGRGPPARGGAGPPPPGPLSAAWMPTGSPRASRPTSSFRRWCATACSMASMKARRWWLPPERTWWLA